MAGESYEGAVLCRPNWISSKDCSKVAAGSYSIL